MLRNQRLIAGHAVAPPVPSSFAAINHQQGKFPLLGGFHEAAQEGIPVAAAFIYPEFFSSFCHFDYQGEAG